MINHFSPKTIEALDNYVYVYTDPRYDEIFYIGKGIGNRAFSHMKEDSESEKVKRIQEIIDDGEEPIIEILAYGLDKETAEIVEAAAIDLIGVENLTNLKRGHGNGEYAIMEAEALDAIYRKEELDEEDVTDNIMLININKRYHNNMSSLELYESTRGFWRVSKTKANDVDYVLAVYGGAVLEVYEVAGWYDALTTMMFTRDDVTIDEYESDYEDEDFSYDRREFVGRVAKSAIRDKYIHKSVEHFYGNGKRNPIRYIMNKLEDEE